MGAGDVLLILMAVILPPLPVAIKRGFCSGAFLLNVFLFLLGVVPGMIHAWYIVLKHPEHVHDGNCPGRDGHGRRVVVVARQGGGNAGRDDLERNQTRGGGGAGGGGSHGGNGRHGGAEGNMDGVYGSTTRPHNQQSQLLSAGGKHYGTTTPAPGSGEGVVPGPPAYSPVDAKDQSRA